MAQKINGKPIGQGEVYTSDGTDRYWVVDYDADRDIVTYIKNPPEITALNLGKIIQICQNISCPSDEFADIVVCVHTEYKSIDTLFKQILGDNGLSIKQIKSLCAAERKTTEGKENKADEIAARHILNRVLCELNNGNNTAWTELTNLKHNMRKTVYGLYSQSLYSTINMQYAQIMKKQQINNDKNMLLHITPYFVSLIEEAWKIIARRWPECFRADAAEEYNIGNDIGLYALHGLLNGCLSSCEGDIENGLELFRNRIMNSQLTSKDWLADGVFKTVDFEHIMGFGLSYEVGMKNYQIDKALANKEYETMPIDNVIKMVANEIPVPGSSN